jgi:ABC-2 type transport system permease protein
MSHLLVALSRNWVRSREAVFFAVLFPIVLLVIFSAVFAGGTAEFTVYVQNEDRGPDGEPTALSAAFVDSLENVSVLDVRSLDPDRNRTAWRRQNRTTATKRVVVVPDGFAADVRNQSLRVRAMVIADTTERLRGGNDTDAGGGDTTATVGADATTTPAGQRVQALGERANASGPVTVRFYTTPDDESAPTVRGIIDSVVARFNQRAIGADEPTVTVEPTSLGGTGLGATDYYLPAFIAAVVVINGVMTVPAVVAGFAHDGTLKRLVATPLRKRDWILANVVHQALLAVALMGVLVLVARLLFGVTAVPGPLAVALVVVGAVAFSALGIALGGFLSDPDAATSLGGAIAFPLMFLSGVFWELDVMPAWLQTVGRLTPLYQFHRGLRRLLILETTQGVVVPFAVLGAMTVVFVALAVRVTDWRDF